MHKFKYKIKNYKTANIFSLFVNIHSSSHNVRASLLTNANTAYSMTPKKIILTFWHRSYICNAHCDADDAKWQVLPTANYGPSYAISVCCRSHCAFNSGATRKSKAKF
jgi:hypothetical protein